MVDESKAYSRGLLVRLDMLREDNDNLWAQLQEHGRRPRTLEVARYSDRGKCYAQTDPPRAAREGGPRQWPQEPAAAVPVCRITVDHASAGI